MFKKLKERLTRGRTAQGQMTRKQQILAELSRGAGTARQVADRTGLKLSIVRVNMSALHKKGLIKDTGVDAGSENVWGVVEVDG